MDAVQCLNEVCCLHEKIPYTFLEEIGEKSLEMTIDYGSVCYIRNM
jgi:hypothetical protein